MRIVITAISLVATACAHPTAHATNPPRPDPGEWSPPASPAPLATAPLDESEYATEPEYVAGLSLVLELASGPQELRILSTSYLAGFHTGSRESWRSNLKGMNEWKSAGCFGALASLLVETQRRPFVSEADCKALLVPFKAGDDGQNPTTSEKEADVASAKFQGPLYFAVRLQIVRVGPSAGLGPPDSRPIVHAYERGYSAGWSWRGRVWRDKAGPARQLVGLGCLEGFRIHGVHGGALPAGWGPAVGTTPSRCDAIADEVFATLSAATN